MNDYYNRGGGIQPYTIADARVVASEFAAVEAGFAKLPLLSQMIFDQATYNFRATIAEAIDGEFAISVGVYFSSIDADAVTAHPNELRTYKRTGTTPFYEDQGDSAAPISKALLAQAAGAGRVGTTGGGTVQQDLDKRPPFDVRAMIGGDGEIFAALTVIKAIGGKAWIAAGTYTFSGTLDQGDMFIEAHPGATITATGSGTAMFTSSGTATALPDLSASPAAGALSITFAAAHGLARGDRICIYNPTDGSFSGFRTYYRAGEFAVVKSVSGLNVTLETPLFAGYTAAAIDLYKIVQKAPRIRGGKWVAGAKYLANYTYCTGDLIDIDALDAASNTAIAIDRCKDWTARVKVGSNLGVGTDDYLVAVLNSQNGRISGLRMYSRRHPVAHGGGDVVCGVPCRDVIVERVVLSNDPAAGVITADHHGNCEFCYYVNCTIYGGAQPAGANNGFPGCTITAKANGPVLEASELLGGEINLRGVKLSSPSVNNASGRGYIDLGTQSVAFNANTTRDVNLVITDFTLDIPNNAAGEVIIRHANNGSSAKLNVEAKRGTLRCGNSAYFLHTNKVSGVAASDGFIVDDVTGLKTGSFWHVNPSADYVNAPHRLPAQRGFHNYTTTAVSSYTSPDILFDVAFPRRPTGRVTFGGQGVTGQSPYLTGLTQLAQAYIQKMGTDRITVMLAAPNAFAVGQNVRMDWQADMAEI